MIEKLVALFLKSKASELDYTEGMGYSVETYSKGRLFVSMTTWYIHDGISTYVSVRLFRDTNLVLRGRELYFSTMPF